MSPVILSYRGRSVTAADLEAIRALLAEHPELSRRAFSQRLCAHWDWRQPNGALRDGVCRSLLLALHRGGHLTLPPVRQQPLNNAIARRRPAPVALGNRQLRDVVAQGPRLCRSERRGESAKRCFHSLGMSCSTWLAG